MLFKLRKAFILGFLLSDIVQYLYWYSQYLRTVNTCSTSAPLNITAYCFVNKATMQRTSIIISRKVTLKILVSIILRLALKSFAVRIQFPEYNITVYIRSFSTYAFMHIFGHLLLLDKLFEQQTHFPKIWQKQQRTHKVIPIPVLKNIMKRNRNEKGKQK